MKSSRATTPTTSRGRRDTAMWVIVLGIVTGALAMSLALRQPKATPPSQANVPTPDAVKPLPEVVAAYTVAPEYPKFIAIPSIELSQTRVIPLGVAKDYKIAAPANLHDAGWYQESARPGQKGAVFVYGHLSSQQSDGAFHNLSRLREGDIIRITRGDDRVFSYSVKARQVYATQAVPMDKVLAPITPGAQGLNLMTCAGQVDQSTGEFSERLVVYATLVKD